MTRDDRPLDTQTAAPPPAPPRHPIVGAAMDDDAHAQQLQDLQAKIEAALQASQAVRDEIAAWEDRYRRDHPPDA